MSPTLLNKSRFCISERLPVGGKVEERFVIENNSGDDNPFNDPNPLLGDLGCAARDSPLVLGITWSRGEQHSSDSTRPNPT